MTADRPIPPAPCLTRRDWQYHSERSHDEPQRFRERQMKRLAEAQPNMRWLLEQEREAA